jgi:GT2 family glycosyltransferase
LFPQLEEVAPPLSSPRTATALVTVIVINYNGAPWLERCLESVRAQSLFAQMEVIVADNASPDDSTRLAARLLEGWPGARVLQHGDNLGYSEGNNRAAEHARGRYLLFLNNDTWLEPDCLERLIEEVRASGAAVATPLVLDYLDGEVQSAGAGGFDIFGFPFRASRWSHRRELFVANGCALLIETDLFRRLGGFDRLFFMYSDESDLCWRAWVAGSKVILAPSARLHHRGAPAVNPRGYQEVLELRTSDSKRFYANRNALLVLLKNSQHLLLFLVPLQLLLLGLEALVTGVLTRRWSYLRRAYLEALVDCWALRGHILKERQFLKQVRKRGDFWMLRFLRGGFNRWTEFRRWRRFGLPKIDPQ